VIQENGDPTTNVALTDCGDGSWCCQGGNTTCCQEGLGIKIAATIGISSTSTAALSTQSTQSVSSGSTAGSSTTNAPTSIPTSPDAGTSTTTPATSPSPQSGGLDTGVKIGITLSAVLAVILIAAAIGFWVHRKRRRYYSVRTTSNPWDLTARELPAVELPRELPEKKGPANFQYELQGDNPPPVELATERYSRGPLPRASRYAGR